MNSDSQIIFNYIYKSFIGNIFINCEFYYLIIKNFDK